MFQALALVCSLAAAVSAAAYDPYYHAPNTCHKVDHIINALHDYENAVPFCRRYIHDPPKVIYKNVYTTQKVTHTKTYYKTKSQLAYDPSVVSVYNTVTHYETAEPYTTVSEYTTTETVSSCGNVETLRAREPGTYYNHYDPQVHCSDPMVPKEFQKYYCQNIMSACSCIHLPAKTVYRTKTHYRTSICYDSTWSTVYATYHKTVTSTYEDPVTVTYTPTSTSVETTTVYETSCSCPDGQELCGGVCVDTSSNSDHCGDCNQTCNGDCANYICYPSTLPRAFRQ